MEYDWETNYLDQFDDDWENYDYHGKIALFKAVQNDNQSIVQALIDAGADVNKVDIDFNGRTALFIAVENDKQSLVQALIDAGADVNKADYIEKTALFYAVENDNQSLVQALIDAGAGVNEVDFDGKTALFYAVENGNQSIVQALIDAGADVNKTYYHGRTALFIAVQNNNQSIVQVLIDAGADVNKADDGGKTVLFIAVLFDNQSIVEPLIDAGALINGRNCYGRTPLFYTLPESPTSARHLLNNGANLFLKDNCNVSFLSFVIENILMKEDSVLNQGLDLLFEKGIRKESLLTKLTEVLFCKILLICNYLGKDIFGKLNTWHIPRFVNKKVVTCMVHKLLSIVDEVDGQTKRAIERILEEASRGQLSQVVPTFIGLGADPNSADQHGNTFLHYVTLLPFEGVSQEVILEICHQLRRYGASVDIRNQEGQTPLLFCFSNIHLHLELLCKSDRVKTLVEICRFLFNCGMNVNDTLPNGETIFHLVIGLFQKGLQLQDEAVRQVVLGELLNLLQLFSGVYTKKGNKGFHLNNMLIHSWASLTLPSSKDYSSEITHNSTFKHLLEAILQHLLKCGAKLNARDDEERVPLHLCKTWSAVKLLINAGANADDVDSSRHPPLFVAAEKYMFLQKLNCLYPDVSEDPKTFWRTAIKMNLDPWTVDQQGGSVLSIIIEKQAFVLAKALIEVTCEDKHIESDTIAYSLLNAICKDESTQSRWKTILVETILNSRQRIPLTNLHAPLQFCCKNLIKFDLSNESSNNSSDENSDYNGLCTPGTRKRKFLDDMETKYNNDQPNFKRAKTDGLFSNNEARRTEDTNEDLAPYNSVHCEIANLLLSNGANIQISDSSGKSCLELAETCPKLQDLLTKPIDTNKISVRIPWNAVSQKYKNRLAKVSVGQEKWIVDSFWYHKDPIGKGSFGHVFSGINEKDGREVAIKRIERLRMIRPEDKREIKNLVILADCEQVVNYLSFLEDEHFSYVVLELMEGDLEQYFKEGPVDRSKNTLLCEDVLKGLKYLHEEKIIHRDLKPENILYKIHPRLCLKIADFGLSRHCKNTPSSTVCGPAVVGTRCWIAPEVLSSETWDSFSEKSDTFSCGLLLHYILSGQKHPFYPSHPSAIHEIETNMVNGEMVGWDTRISPEATDLLKKMLRTDGKERPSPNDSLSHPFFWTKSKRKDFLVAVGNQPEFEFWPCKRSFPETDLERDLSSSNVFETIVKGKSWDDPKNRFMPKFYHEMAKRRNYDTQSIVDLVRLIRNGYAHFSSLPRPIRRLLTNFAYLDYFPDLVIEVFKAVTNHEWDCSRPEIKHVINKEE